MNEIVKKVRKPFKWTRELIQLAINDGWTQTEVAKTCRTQQSIVSAWFKGEKQGTEQQLKPLLDLFGHKLRKKTFRIYWNIDPCSDEKIFFKVEGKIIFSRALYDKQNSKTPEYKFIIHDQGNNTFRIVKQSRFRFHSTNEELENEAEDAIFGSIVSDIKTAQEVVTAMDKLISDEEITQKYPNEVTTFPFLVRKALLENGFAIEGIKEYLASW